jgi:hypothetical protein
LLATGGLDLLNLFDILGLESCFMDSLRNVVLSFLEQMCRIFKWEKYENQTLGRVSKNTGKHGALSWYAVILSQWMSGQGLSQIMYRAIDYKEKNPESGVQEEPWKPIVPYNRSHKHKNLVISSMLEAIEEVVLFRISNYFLKFSLAYKEHHKIRGQLINDWYEFVEYGTTNPLTIFLQRNGFSREASTYIKSHIEDYLLVTDDGYRIRPTLLDCRNKSVCREAIEVRYNIPEIFSDSAAKHN